MFACGSSMLVIDSSSSRDPPPAGRQDLPGGAATARPPRASRRDHPVSQRPRVAGCPAPPQTPETWGFDFPLKPYYISWHAGRRTNYPPQVEEAAVVSFGGKPAQQYPAVGQLETATAVMKYQQYLKGVVLDSLRRPQQYSSSRRAWSSDSLRRPQQFSRTGNPGSTEVPAVKQYSSSRREWSSDSLRRPQQFSRTSNPGISSSTAVPGRRTA